MARFCGGGPSHLTAWRSPARTRTRHGIALGTRQVAGSRPVERKVGRRFVDVLLTAAAYPEQVTLTLVAVDALESPTLRKRAEVHATDDVVLLRAHVGVDEFGLVVLDLDSGDDNEAVLVEIFVIPDRRSAGLGSEALTCAEGFAREAGRRRISLDAENA